MLTSRLLQSAITILTLLSQCRVSNATPLGPTETEGIGLEKRCDNPCGYYSQLCCASNEVCSTNDSNQAVCVSSGSGSGGGSGSGSWEYFTTTYVITETEVQTVTSVWSSWVPSPTDSTCRAELGETVCGDDCCGAAFVCENNQCVMGSTSVWATETANPPVRGTTSTTVTQTATITQGFEAPVTTDGTPAYGVDAPDDDGLSGGAIAGIVIGTIAGVFLLLLVCACLCCRGVIAGILGCLGLGKRKRRETTYVEDHYSHHTHAARPEGRTWFGARPSGSGGEGKSSWSSLATIGIVLGALALCLGLRRKKDQDEKSDYTYPSYYSYYTSTTSESSDRRTRQSRRSGRSRSRTHS